jgi:4-alpha-glucanotransferase
MHLSRSSGILLHPTSLPGRWGIGDLGSAAYQFVDFLTEAGQRLWQILPLGPTGFGNSPYQCLSSFAGNHLLISLDRLVEEGLLRPDDLYGEAAPPLPTFSDDQVDYDAVTEFKMPLLQRSFDYFRQDVAPAHTAAFKAFCATNADWLDDYTLFVAIKDHQDGASWDVWDLDIRLREPEALKRWQNELADYIEMRKYFQYLFFHQWRALKAYANERNIRIVGDMPIFVAYDGSDVWGNPELFYLDEENHPTVVAGVPPDYFSATGQLWGNPLYRWDQMAENGYVWWMRRVKSTLDMVDIVRLDHFRGFEAYWEVPAGEETAVNGQWVKGPGNLIFETLASALGDLPIIAEDLGLITSEVEDLRDNFDLPGMKVLHFAFGDTAKNPYLPHNYTSNYVVYTGTHDNDTTLGWYESREDWERAAITRYLGHPPEDICWDMLRLALSSVADMAVFPIQDPLRLGSEARMNIPGQAENNWAWRLRADALTSELAQNLRQLTVTYGRLEE